MYHSSIASIRILNIRRLNGSCCYTIGALSEVIVLYSNRIIYYRCEVVKISELKSFPGDWDLFILRTTFRIKIYLNRVTYYTYLLTATFDCAEFKLSPTTENSV